MGDKFRPSEELWRGNKHDICIERGFKYPFVGSLCYCKTSLLLKNRERNLSGQFSFFVVGKTEARR